MVIVIMSLHLRQVVSMAHELRSHGPMVTRSDHAFIDEVDW